MIGRKGIICEPSRPEGPLVISNIQADSVHLSWKPPLEDYGGPILGYVIEAKDVLHMDVRKINFWSDGQNTEYDVTGLETSHIYQFRVYAQNVAGRSEGLLNKTLVRIKAASKKPPTPSKPSVEIHDNDSAHLQWTVPTVTEDLNYIIERFEPKYGMWIQCNKEIITRTSYLVTGLAPNREYTFRVSSENVHSVSKPSEKTETIYLTETICEQPVIIIPIADCFVEQNGLAVFVCEFTGTPPIQVIWTKDGIRVRESSFSTIKSEEGLKSELKLQEVESDDDDVIIQCILKNSAGEITSEAKIKILSPPRISCPPSYREGLTYDMDDTLRIRITVLGTPLPKVEWFLNEEVVSTRDEFEVIQDHESFELKKKDVTRNHSGNYKFLATNEVGEDHLTVKVTVSGPPDPIKDGLIFDFDEDEGVVIKWNPPSCDGGSEIFNYIVEKRMEEDINWFKLATSRNTYLNLGMFEETEGCYFRVKSINVFGISAPSEERKYLRTMNLVDDKNDKQIEHEHEFLADLNQAKQADLTVRKGSTKEYNFDNSSPGEITTDFISFIPNDTELSIPNKLICHATEDMLDSVTEGLLITIEETSIDYKSGTYTMDYNEFYLTWLEIISLEKDAFFENKPLTHKCTRQWNMIDVSVEIFEAFSCIYLNLANFITIDEVTSRTKWLILPSLSTKFTDLITSQIEFAICSVVEEVNLAIIVFQPEDLETCKSFQSHLNHLKVSVTWDCFRPILINDTQIFENVHDFINENSEQYCKMSPTVHPLDDYETLATLTPIPLMNCKMALSVLPFKQKSHTIPTKTRAYSTTANNESEALGRLRKTSDELNSSYIRELGLDDALESNYVLDAFETDILEKSASSLLSAEKSRLISLDTNKYIDEEDTKFDMDDLLISDDYIYDTPSWLPFISPNSSLPDTFKTETVEFKDTEEDHSPTLAQRVSLKGKSFEELLLIAEQVEKSFSQKAQQIESLENILHEELDSLEKDLQVVHEIHQSLNGNAIEKDVALTDERKTKAIDLIDFSEDVHDMKTEEPKLESYPPKVITHLQNKVVQRGSRARLYCSITGDPAPDVVWLKNGKLLKEKSRYIFNDLMEFGFYVDIYSIKSTDSGQYICLATNPHGSAQTEAYLQVIGEREDSPEVPKFLDCPDDVTATEGETVSLEWKMTGTPVPNVIWFKNAERIETNLRVDVYSNHKGACRLKIHRADEQDSAIYSCYLENEIGSAVSTVLISVKEDKSSLRNIELNQSCQENKSFFERSQSSSSSESDICCAEIPNPKIPKDQAVSNIPGPPSTLSIFSVGRTWVMLSWSPPMSHLTKKSSLTYLIESRLLNSSHWKEVGKTRNTIYTAHGFKCKRSYAFRVSAGNSYGWGRPAVLSQQVNFLSR
ncbi:twitchin [Parasteatoda tepidariorum]|uniref:twitchin n=1 Tax=Parasteatoda tepidariorum TaxID=114398 RepID=UPI0039BCA0B9